MITIAHSFATEYICVKKITHEDRSFKNF